VSGGGSKRSASAMTVEGDASEVVEDNDIWVVSDDRGDKEVNPNENVWSRSCV